MKREVTEDVARAAAAAGDRVTVVSSNEGPRYFVEEDRVDVLRQEVLGKLGGEGRYRVGEEPEHSCCYDATVVDTTDWVAILDNFRQVCACGKVEEARQIAKALNTVARG